LMAGKKPTGLRKSPSLRTRVLLCVTLPLTTASAALVLLTQTGALLAGLIMLAGLAFAITGIVTIFRPLQRTILKAHSIADDPIAQFIYTGRTDDIGQLQLAYKMLESEMAALIGRIADSAGNMTDGIGQLSDAVMQSQASLQRQSAETEQVASAINQMTASIQEVATNADRSAATAAHALDEVAQGKKVVDENVLSIHKLKDSLASAAGV